MVVQWVLRSYKNDHINCPQWVSHHKVTLPVTHSEKIDMHSIHFMANNTQLSIIYSENKPTNLKVINPLMDDGSVLKHLPFQMDRPPLLLL